MIYGIVPVGGEGIRLGLPFPKELFPLKSKNSYYPVCQHTIDNMLEAGCEKIIFVHGKVIKDQIVSRYSLDNHQHIQNLGTRQSEVFTYVMQTLKAKEGDIFLYGLPDSWYPENIFQKMIEIPGIVCGMFNTKNNSIVDRLNNDRKFIKCARKDESVSVECWGVLKFDYENFKNFANVIEKTDFEVASALNQFNFSLCFGSDYFDLGTWESMNDYWSYEIDEK